MISGRDSLVASVKVDLAEIVDFLPVCMEKYESDAYKRIVPVPVEIGAAGAIG
jgi:hypothetical protein